jgi:hypothetical protein
MTKTNITLTMTIRRISFLQILLLLVLTVSCGKKNGQNSNQIAFQSEWWYPIIQKHKIDLSQFNYKVTFACIDSNNGIINKWFELGNDNGSDERYLKLKDVLIIVMFDTTNLLPSKGNYWILTSPGILHDQERNTIDYDWGKTVTYDIKDKNIIPLDTMESYGKFDLNQGLKIAPDSFKRLNP